MTTEIEPEVEPMNTGQCDVCGENGKLTVINSAPIAGMCICEKCINHTLSKSQSITKDHHNHWNEQVMTTEIQSKMKRGYVAHGSGKIEPVEIVTKYDCQNVVKIADSKGQEQLVEKSEILPGNYTEKFIEEVDMLSKTISMKEIAWHFKIPPRLLQQRIREWKK